MKHQNKEKSSKSNYILTKETLGMTLMLFSAIVLVMLFSGSSIFAGIGKAICTFLYGTFGYGSILLVLLLAYLGEWLVFGKKISISVKSALCICLVALCAFLLFHASTTRNYVLTGYGRYISDCYKNADKGFSGYTFGGVISALVVFPVAKLTTFTGAYIIFSLFTIASGYLLFKVLSKRGSTSIKREKSSVKFQMADAITETQESEDVVKQQIVAEPQYIRHELQEINYAENYEEQPQKLSNNVNEVQRDENINNDDSDPYSRKNLGRKILFEKGKFDAESYRRNLIFSEDSYFNHPINTQANYLGNFGSGAKSAPQKTYAESYQADVLNQPVMSAPANYVFGDKPVDQLTDTEHNSGEIYSVHEPKHDDEKVERETAIPKVEEQRRAAAKEEKPDILNSTIEKVVSDDKPHDEITGRTDLFRRSDRMSRSKPPVEDNEAEESDSGSVDMFKLFGSTNSLRGENRIEPDVSRLTSRRSQKSKVNLFDDENKDGEDEIEISKPAARETIVPERRTEKTEEERTVVQKAETENIRKSEPQIARQKEPQINAEAAAPETPKQEDKPKHIWKKYVRPSLELLDNYPENSNVNTGEIEDNKSAIVETLAKFKIESEVSNVVIGPAVTRYDVVIEDKTKITQSLKYKEAIAMALMKDNVTAYLNFSKGALSIEVPNNHRTVVGLKSILASQKFINCKQNTVTFALGKNVEGEVVCPDITKMPHLLVAGTTGSGKSICLSSLIISLLYKYGPEELRFILVDPKQVEFIPYDKLPHLMINEIISDVDKSIKALNWANKEMERRYSLFKDMTEQGRLTKTLDEYNHHLPEGEEKLPKIVIILDEFGDLMMQAKKDIEGKIIKLVQKARACGIHLILATQRPSVDCITGLIKSNLPTRIGFKVNSFDDSRTIFDIGGAEKLLGKGDMYFRSPDGSDLARIQGCFIDSHEVQKVTDFIKEHNETYFDQSVSDFINTVEVEEQSGGGMEEGGVEASDMKIDETHIKALYYCVTSNQASVSMIQRRFPVGYIKACKIIDWMENMNYVSQSEGSKPRKVLLTKDEFIKIYGEIDD